MGRATIADIARSAGVSTATVDRALNGRRGISAMNRHRVMAAARDLGYVPSDGVYVLPARPVRLQFLIPKTRSAFLAELGDALLTCSDRHPLVARCDLVPLEGIGPDALVAGLDAISINTDGIGIVATDHPRTRDALTRVTDAGVRVITLVSDLPGTARADYVGVDNTIAGRTAAQILGLFLQGGTGAVALFSGSRAYAGHQEREAGFRDRLGVYAPGLRLLPTIETEEDDARVRREITRMLRLVPDLIGIYCAGAGRRGIVEALDGLERRPKVVLHDLTDSARTWLRENKIDAVIDQNAQLVAELAVQRLLAAIAATSAIPHQLPIEPRILLRENLPETHT
jgi:LacI family transcriptional regulator